MALGQNTVSGQMLQSFVERIERIRADKKALAADEAVVLAEAKSSGFHGPMIKAVVKRRAAKPHDVQEADAMLDMYEHALGMRPDTPLERIIGRMTVDTASRDSVIEAMKPFVPNNGSITVEAGGKPVRLSRDKDGNVSVTEIIEQPAQPATPAAGVRKPARPEVPDVDDAGAEALGRQAFKANQPIISNPFPFGDSRRQHFDKGWRLESGTDGMGPDDGED